MDTSEYAEELLTFFKALADQNRLRIVGILAQEAHTVEEIAKLLGVGVSTTSHHLSRLAKSGLVSANPEGHYYRYSLHTDILQEMSQRILSEDVLPTLNQQLTPMSFEDKVLKTFTDSTGRITAFPKPEKKFAVLIEYVFKAFEKDRIYTGQEIEDILLRYSDDTASLRRALIEYQWMARSSDGSRYWVITKSES